MLASISLANGNLSLSLFLYLKRKSSARDAADRLAADPGKLTATNFVSRWQRRSIFHSIPQPCRADPLDGDELA